MPTGPTSSLEAAGGTREREEGRGLRGSPVGVGVEGSRNALRRDNGLRTFLSPISRRFENSLFFLGKGLKDYELDPTSRPKPSRLRRPAVPVGRTLSHSVAGESVGPGRLTHGCRRGVGSTPDQADEAVDRKTRVSPVDDVRTVTRISTSLGVRLDDNFHGRAAPAGLVPTRLHRSSGTSHKTHMRVLCLTTYDTVKIQMNKLLEGTIDVVKCKGGCHVLPRFARCCERATETQNKDIVGRVAHSTRGEAPK